MSDRHLTDIRERIERKAADEPKEPATPLPEPPAPPSAAEREAAEAAFRAQTDPYAAHVVDIGTKKTIHPKTRALVNVLTVSCSCGFADAPVPSLHAAALTARVHGLEVALHRVARAAGVDLTSPPDDFERALGGDPEALAAIEARRAELADRLGVDDDEPPIGEQITRRTLQASLADEARRDILAATAGAVHL